jgi:hypothetical protein
MSGGAENHLSPKKFSSYTFPYFLEGESLILLHILKPSTMSITLYCKNVMFVILTCELRNQNTVELHLSRLIGMASHLDMQKIWIIGFLFENRL